MCLCEIFQDECMRDLVADQGVSSSHPKTWNVLTYPPHLYINWFILENTIFGFSVNNVDKLSTKVQNEMLLQVLPPIHTG